MRRYSLVQLTGTGAAGDPIRPNVSGDYVMLADRGNWCVVKLALPDGTAVDNNTLADLDTTNGAQDVTLGALTGAQLTAIKNRLTTAGFDVSQFDGDGVTSRRALLRFVLRRLMLRADLWNDTVMIVHGFDATGSG